MPRFGSDANSLSQSIAGVSDESGNQLIDTSVDFFASPLGVAARAQALFGIANAQFNLLPPDPLVEIVDFSNPLPYWSAENLSDGRLTAISTFDTTTGTWGVVLNPTAGSAADSITLKTRSYLLNDDNLALRQKAFLTLAKSGTAAGTTQFNVVLTAEYFTTDDVSLTGGTAFAIGTALDTATFTTINGFTTAGTAAVGASAAYVDIKVTLTCSADVTGSAQATLKSMLLQTSTGGGGGAQSFIVSETFTSSDTWTRPTGVEYLLAIIGVGGGGGGGGGGLVNRNGGTAAGTSISDGGGSGAAGVLLYQADTYIGNLSTVSIGIGAGGSGGTAVTATNGQAVEGRGGSATAGGATTFGAFITAAGGGGGFGGSATFKSTAAGREGLAGTVTAGSDRTISLGGTTITRNGEKSGDASSGTATSGGNGSGLGTNSLPFLSYTTSSSLAASGTPSATGGTVSANGTAVYSSADYIDECGGSGPGIIQIGTAVATVGAAGNAAWSGGRGGGGAARYFATAGTIVVIGGDGGDAAASSGSGGGGGGPALRIASTNAVQNSSSGSAASGKGGSAASGWVQIVYVA